MHIWLDMANSPHPVLLGPLGRELEARGHQLFITARDHAQTRELSVSVWPDARIVGGESPGSRLQKASAIAGRVVRLRRVARPAGVDVAVSLGSYSQIVAARSMRVPTLTLMDYEYQPANHLSFRLADRVVVPRVFPQRQLEHFGAGRGKAVSFDGFKEELYLDTVDEPEASPRARSDTSKAVFRPPPEGALYHKAGNVAFDAILETAARRPDVSAVVLPRMRMQRALYERMPDVCVPSEAVNGLELLRSADLFVGAGGTMSREAALLGVRAYTLFAGRLAAVDGELINRGLLQDLRGQAPDSINWTPRTDEESKAARGRRQARAQELRSWLADRIEELG